MATYIHTMEKSVTANAIDQEIGSLTPPDGEKYHILALSWALGGAGYILGGIKRETNHTLRDTVEADANHPVPVDYEVEEGQEHWFKGTDTSGAANKMQVMVVYEILPAS